MPDRPLWRSALVGLTAAALALGVVVNPVGAYTGAGGGTSGSGGSTSGSGGSPSTSLSTSADPIVPGQIILRLNTADDLAAIAAQYSLQPLDQLLNAPLYLTEILDGAPAETRAVALAADSRVVYAETNVIGAAPKDEASSWANGASATDYAAQWAPAVIRLAQAQAVTRGAGTTVAVLDTGVDATHPSLVGHLVPGYDFVDGDTDPTEVGVPLVNKAYGHGTFVAGLVALVAPEAHILPVRVLNPDGQSDVWRLSKGMVFAAASGANVINLSLGTNSRTHVTNELISNLTTVGRGITVVAAAGNNANNVPLFPAAEGGARVLSVAATTQTDTLAPFSDFGSWVRVGAPGVSILSSIPGGGFASWSGTSMATGFVSGEAALVRASNPNSTPQDVIGRIVNSSTRISGLVPLRINIGAALGQ